MYVDTKSVCWHLKLRADPGAVCLLQHWNLVGYPSYSSRLPRLTLQGAAVAAFASLSANRSIVSVVWLLH